MKDIMHQIWKNRLFPKNGLTTSSGERLQVMDSGKCNNNKSVFTDAKIKIGDNVWAGNVVLHSKSSDWEQEIRDNGACTDNVILHVTLHNDCTMLRKHGEEIQQLCLTCTDSLNENIFSSTEKECRCIAIDESDTALDKINVHAILSKLLIERIEEKACYIEKLHEECGKNWEETLFKILIRSFGFGIHSRQFEELAATMDFSALGKHRDNPTQVEAIFFGQAGLLNEDSIPYYYREFVISNDYFKELKREYLFLENKFKLKSMSPASWDGCSSTPHLRIARLSTIFSDNKFCMSNIAESYSIKDLYKIIDHTLQGYWQNHTCFGGTETYGNGNLKPSQIEVIIINAIAPMLFIYGRHRKEYSLCGKAEDFLHALRCEENSIVRRWREKGLIVGCAADSQALLQLSRAYCSKKKCKECLFAFRYIKNAIKCC